MPNHHSLLAPLSAQNLVFALALASLSACAGSPTLPVIQTSRELPEPPVVTGQNYGAVKRQLRKLHPGSGEFAELRGGLVNHLSAKAKQAIEANGKGKGDDSFEAVFELTATIVDFYSGDEIEQGKLPPAVSDLSKWLLKHGERRADEGAVLGALLLLHKMHPDAPEYARYYGRLESWGTSARATLPSPIWMESDGLPVWKRHTRLSPTPQILSALARQHMEQRERLIRRLRMAEGRFALSAQEFEYVQHKSFDIAGVFLRRGDLAGALSHLKTLAVAGPSDSALVEFLRRAQRDDDDSADALAGLADTRSFGHRDPAVAQALCELGVQRYPSDARFLHCLGSLAALQDDVDGTIDAYEQAISGDATDHRLRDAYQLDLYRLLSDSSETASPARTDRIAAHLIAALQARLTGWPDEPATISPAKLYLAVSMAEMNVGQTDKAESRLRESLKFEETQNARNQLASLLFRLNRPQEAITHYKASLAEASVDGGHDTLNVRAELQERIGDAQRMSGNPAAANSAYQQALTHWADLMPHLSGAQVGLSNIRRGILFSRLGEPLQSQAAFKEALSQAPGIEDTYKRILAHLAVVKPDLDLATSVFHHAQNQLNLDAQWKVYLALWLQLVASRAHTEAPSEAVHLLEDFAGKGVWWSQLAAFGAGKLSYAQLLEQATDLGKRTEATFYEGSKRLQAGDLPAAKALFEEVLASKLVNFYEYIMAHELLALPALANLPRAAEENQQPQTAAPTVSATSP